MTRTVALQGRRGKRSWAPTVRGHFDAQLAAFDLVLDAATNKFRMTEAWLRDLHSTACAGQETYKVWTDSGWQERQAPFDSVVHGPLWEPYYPLHRQAADASARHERGSMEAVDAVSDSRGAWTMIEHLMVELASMFPLIIKEAAFVDPTLTLAGDGWAFSSPSAWRVVKDGVLEFGWSNVDASELVWDLCGFSIVSVAPQSSAMAGDPAFEISDGRWLEIFSDHAIDPWSMRLPGMTFVGSPSDPSQTN